MLGDNLVQASLTGGSYLLMDFYTGDFIKLFVG